MNAHNVHRKTSSTPILIHKSTSFAVIVWRLGNFWVDMNMGLIVKSRQAEKLAARGQIAIWLVQIFEYGTPKIKNTV